MPVTLIGPGLLGCYLAAAGGIDRVVTGPSGKLRGDRIRLPDDSVVDWQPRQITRAGADDATLVACRCPDTPKRLPQASLLAQNGLGQTIPTIACFLAIDQDVDGVIHHTGPTPRLVLGPIAERFDPIVAAWRRKGIHVETVTDNRAARWEKCILNATVGPLCLAGDFDMATVWREQRARVLSATMEGLRIGHAAGVPLDRDLIDRATAFFDGTGAHRPSVCADPRELTQVFDPLLAAADTHQIACPELRAIHRAASPLLQRTA